MNIWNYNVPRKTYCYRNITDWDQNESDPNFTCNRCRSDFGEVVNCGDICPCCKLKVCKACREYCDQSVDWICTICYDFMKIDKLKYESHNIFIPAAKQIKKTIYRSWTISGSTRKIFQSFSHNRLYKSLPKKLYNYDPLKSILKNWQQNSIKRYEKNLENFHQKSFRRKFHLENSDKNSIEMFDYDFNKKIQPLEGDDYKLVFINSESSIQDEYSERDEYADNDDDMNDSFDDTKSIISSESRKSFNLDDCDWDYFEPFSTNNYYNCSSWKNNPCLKQVLNSEQYAVMTKKIEFKDNLNQNYQCHSCGSMGVKLVPIPMPIAVPITAVSDRLQMTEYLTKFLQTILEKSDPSLINTLCIESNRIFQREPETDTFQVASHHNCTDTQFCSNNRLNNGVEMALKNNGESLSVTTSSISSSSSSSSTSTSISSSSSLEEIDKCNINERKNRKYKKFKSSTKKFVKVYEINSIDMNKEDKRMNSNMELHDNTIELKSIKLLSSEENKLNKLSKSTLENVGQSQQIVDNNYSTSTAVIIEVGTNEEKCNKDAQQRFNNADSSNEIVDKTVVFCGSDDVDDNHNTMINEKYQQQQQKQIPNKDHIDHDDNDNSNDDDNDDDEISVKSIEEFFDFGQKNLSINNDNKIVNNKEKRKPVVVKKCQNFDENIVEVHYDNDNNASVLDFFEDGLADDDSWVEEINHEINIDSNEKEDADEEEEEEENVVGDNILVQEVPDYSYRRSSIDFPLHTIVEESCEDSESDTSLGKLSSLKLTKQSDSKCSAFNVTDLERYFFYGLNDENIIHSSSETSSTYSEDLSNPVQSKSKEFGELVALKLEKFAQISESMETLTENRKDSDGSVGSDSEGKPSPEQKRNKKLVKARNLIKLYSNSTDSVLNENVEDNNSNNIDCNSNKLTQAILSSDKVNESPESLRRKKIKKLLNGTTTDLIVSTFHEKQQQHSRDSGFVDSSDDLLKDQKIAQQNEEFRLTQCLNNNQLIRNILIRNDSFNNTSSDEETNLMMTKMRQFLRNMIQKQNDYQENYKPAQLMYFENELTRLMKLVPGLKDEQVKEIVEYLSSEDTWSDSYDSSDYTNSDLDNNKKSVSSNKVICEQSGEVPNKETSIVYQKLIKSLSNSKRNLNNNSDLIINEIMEHIGSRLVALMHEVSHNTNNNQNIKDNQPNENSLILKSEQNLLRSKSHDLLLDENKLTQSMENVEERETASDYEQFSWRGSFESALLVTDSRVKLSNTNESTLSSSSSSSLAFIIATKRRSAGDLLFNQKSYSSREQLDRVRSCGSIGGDLSDDKTWAKKTHLISNISITSDSEDSDTDVNNHDNIQNQEISKMVTLPRNTVQNIYISNTNIVTNSLPRLPTTTSSIVFQKAYSSHHMLQNSIKSARYRPPGFSKNFSTTKATSTPRFYLLSSNSIENNESECLKENKTLQNALVKNKNRSATSSPITTKSTIGSIISRGTNSKTRSSLSSFDLQNVHDDDIVSFHKNKNSYSSLGLRSDSMTSVYSGNDENHYRNITIKGQVQFSLLYNYMTNNLEINIKQCRDLAAIDLKRNRSDPYIKMYLLPDKSKTGKRKTKVKKHTLNPIFNECLKFNILLNQLQKRTLWLTVWHFDIFGRNIFLGEVRMNLENLVFDNPIPNWYTLQKRTEFLEDSIQFRGDLIIGLKFIPPESLTNSLKRTKKSKGELHILIKEAKNLFISKSINSCNPFCKSYLLPDKSKTTKQKTSIQKKTINPTWNQTFIYQNVTLEELHNKCLELTVWNHDLLSSNEFLGGVRLSLGTENNSITDSNEKEINFWQSMINKPNFWVECSLSLKLF